MSELRKGDGWIALSVFVLTAALFARALVNDFVDYDDEAYVVANELVLDGLTPAALRGAFTQSVSANWHPLTVLSHALDVELFGLDPAGHHATSVGLHALTAALVYLFVVRATGARPAALVVALLFAWHPLRVESVAWIAERKDVLSGALCLATLHAYATWARSGSRGALALALSFFALGLMAKSMLVTVPVLLLLLDRWPLGREGFRWREKLPFLALAAACAAAAVLSQRAGGTTADLSTLPLGARVSNAFVATGTYLVQTLWPVGLAPFYPHPGGFGDSQLAPALACALALIALCTVAWKLRERAPWLGVGLGWFLVALLPVVGLVQIGMQSHADRYTYLPSIGIALAIVFSLRMLPPRAMLGLALPALVACALLTWHQVGRWHDTLTLFEHARGVTQRNHIALRALGNAYLARNGEGDLDRAIAAYEEELALGLDDGVLSEVLGKLYAERGDSVRAREYLEHADALTPDPTLDLLEELGRVQMATGDAEAAVASFRRALALAPDDAIAHHNLGAALERAGDVRGAIQCYRDALELDPTLEFSAARLRELSE